MIEFPVLSLLLLAVSAVFLGILNYLLRHDWPKTAKAAISLAGIALLPAAAGIVVYASTT